MTAVTASERRAASAAERVPGADVEVVRWMRPAGAGEAHAGKAGAGEAGAGEAGAGEGTVVWLSIDRLDTELASAEVTPGEQARAAGYTNESDRLLSLGSAWLMRRLVATFLDVAPREAPIVRECAQCGELHGRPIVSATRDGARIQVSATRSRGLVGVALSTSGAVGLDVENLHSRGPKVWPTVWRALGRPALPEGPLGGPVSGTEAVHTAATAWVRTEAVLKATGHGLAVSGRSVDITSGPRPCVVQWPWGDPSGRVSLFDVNPGPRYVGALAVILDDGVDFKGVVTW